MTNFRILVAALLAVALAAATSVPVLGASSAAACQTTGGSCGG